MFTVILVGIFLIAMYSAGSNGEWGSVAVGAVIVILLLALSSAGRGNAKAFNNFRDYWKDGGPKR